MLPLYIIFKNVETSPSNLSRLLPVQLRTLFTFVSNHSVSRLKVPAFIIIILGLKYLAIFMWFAMKLNIVYPEKKCFYE